MSRFASLHPLVAAVYFSSVLLITMFATNPLLLAAALIGGVTFFVKMQKNGRFFKELRFYLLIFAGISLTNPLFSHHGVTPLFFLNGNPVTLEALLYGMELAMMLITVMVWFRCFHQVMTQDKLLFLLGKSSPKLALLISSSLRFIPLLKAQARRIRQAQQALGLYASDAWTDKLKGTVRVYSALITWALENAIDTGSSMKARGYGLKGRRHYSLYTFRKSDARLLFVIAVLDGIIIAPLATGQLTFSFYPSLSALPLNLYTLPAVIAFAALCLLPFILDVKEGLQWNYYRSKL